MLRFLYWVMIFFWMMGFLWIIDFVFNNLLIFFCFKKEGDIILVRFFISFLYSVWNIWCKFMLLVVILVIFLRCEGVCFLLNMVGIICILFDLNLDGDFSKIF